MGRKLLPCVRAGAVYNSPVFEVLLLGSSDFRNERFPLLMTAPYTLTPVVNGSLQLEKRKEESFEDSPSALLECCAACTRRVTLGKDVSGWVHRGMRGVPCCGGGPSKRVDRSPVSVMSRETSGHA